MKLEYIDEEKQDSPKKSSFEYLDKKLSDSIVSERKAIISDSDKINNYVLPGLNRVENQISQRQSPVDILRETFRKPFPNAKENLDEAMVASIDRGLKTLAIPMGAINSAVSSGLLAAQRGEPKEIIPDILAGLSLQRNTSLGDLFETLVKDDNFVGQVASQVGGFTGEVIAGNAVVNRMAKGIQSLRPFNDERIMKLAEQGKIIANRMDGAISSAYSKIYGKYNSAPLTIEKGVEFFDILKHYKVSPTIQNEIVEQLGDVPTINELHQASQILRRRIPGSVKSGSQKIVGGTTAPRFREASAAQEVKRLIRTVISETDKEGPAIAKKLQALDSKAYKEFYPTLNKLESMYGRGTKIKTSSIVGAFTGGPGKAAERTAIKKTPKTMSELREFIQSDYIPELKKGIKEASELHGELKQFARREKIKRLLLNPAVNVGIGYAVGKGIGKVLPTE